MSRIVYFTRFLPSLQRGGGSRRTLQIIETLQDLNIKIISAPRGDGVPSGAFKQIEEAARQLDITTDDQPSDLAPWSPQRRRGVFRLRDISRAWGENESIFQGLSLAIVDDPLYFHPLADSLKQRGIPIAAICHNIESLSVGQVTQRSTMALLTLEIGILKKSALVVTISKEEDWLLNNLGIPSYCFPYFPVAEVKERMLSIRQKRIHTKKNGYLMVGTAHNIQTRRGMEQLLHFWIQRGLSKQFGPLQVAGYATETFIQKPDTNRGVELLGSLADDALDNVLSQTKGCICYQESGAGALTRIPELLLANVPILANTYAARSYSGQPGVIEFGRLDGLPDLLNANEPLEHQSPPPAAPGKQILVDKIKELLTKI